MMEIACIGDGRAIKRQRTASEHAKPKRNAGASRIFAPYRTVGLVSSTCVPFTSIPLGKTTFQITTSVGRSLQTYDLKRGLHLVFITRPQTPELITASEAWQDSVLAAWGGATPDARRGVWAFKRGKKSGELKLPNGWAQNVERFCVFGSWLVGVCKSQLLVWKSVNLELYTTIQGVSPIPFTKTIVSLPTFLNKIIVGREDGSAEIWNVSTGKLVHTLLPPSTVCGAVTALTPTPALSLVAIAYSNGTLLIQDVKTDMTVIRLNSPEGSPVTSISFRTDDIGAGEDGGKPGAMATASSDTGDVTLWDLNDGGRKTGVLRAAHAHPASSTPGSVNKVEFLAGQAVLVSSGVDNSLKTWIFDQTPFSPIPRALHSRNGHGAPVTQLHFLPSASDGSDDTGKWLMSGSKDRSLWGWSLRRDGQSTELSQGAVQKKAKKQGLLAPGFKDSLEKLKCPPVTSIACCLNRDGGVGATPGRHSVWHSTRQTQVNAELSASTGWESVVTAHEDDRKARTWFWGRKRAGRWAFETSDEGNVSSVAMSLCGTFAVIGSDKGGIDMFNMQSGIHRQRYPVRLTPMQAKQLKVDVEKHAMVQEDKSKKVLRGQGKHGSSVVGLAIDNLSQTVVSAGADGKVKFWDFASGLLRSEMDWSTFTTISAMRLQRDTDLAAFACGDGCVRVVDISTQKLIRELWPSQPLIPAFKGAKIADFAFSADGYWIVACVDQVVLLWDLPTGNLIDAFKLMGKCTSLAFSPTAEFLATATTDGVGVDIWSNRTLFTHVPTRRITRQDLEQIVAGQAQTPTVSGELGQAQISTGQIGDESEDEDPLAQGVTEAAEVDLLSSELLSLSLVPRNKWQTLLHLEAIRARNKPIEPPKKPNKVPFFLPSVGYEGWDDRARLDPNKAVDEAAAIELNKERARISKVSLQGSQTTKEFSALIAAAAQDQKYAPVIEYIKSLGPAAADIEIRSLQIEEMTTFVYALTWLLRGRSDFELVQAWMAVFLRVHGEVVNAGTNPTAREAVAQWVEVLRLERKRLDGLLGYCSGVLGWIGSAKV